MAYPILAPNQTWYRSSTAKSAITQIKIVDNYTVTGNENETWNADVNNSGSIKCYRTGSVITIAGDGSGKISTNTDSSYIFSDKGSANAWFSELLSIEGAELLDTTVSEDMNHAFHGCLKLESVDVSNWNTSNVTDMCAMFQVCISLKELNLSNWDVSNVTRINNFILGHSSYGDISITTLGDISNWNLSSCTNMQSMFQRCSRLTELDLSNWDTSACTDMSYMFGGCTSLTELDVSGWDTRACTNMTHIFYGCTSLTGLDVSGWNTGACTDMSYMFYNCQSLAKLNVSGWDTGVCTAMSYMFCQCFGLTELDLSNWDTGACTTMHCMFQQGNYGSPHNSIKTLDVSNWDVSNVTDMGWMFYGNQSLTRLDLSKWNVSKVEVFHHCFAHCGSLVIEGTENWDVSSVLYFNAIFNNNKTTYYDLSKWNVSKCLTFSQMFEANSALTEIRGLENWDTSSGKDFCQMFSGCTRLKKLNLSSFDTRNASSNWIDPKNGQNGGLYNIFGVGENPDIRLEQVILGPNFSFVGDGTCTTGTEILPTPNPAYIDGADGMWYNEYGKVFSPVDIPSNTAATYFASKYIIDTNVLIKYGTLTKVADSIRSVNKSNEVYKPSDMPDAIKNLKNADDRISATDDGEGNVSLMLKGFTVTDDDNGNIMIRYTITDDNAGNIVIS